MKIERQIQVALAMLRRESDAKRQIELLTLLVLLKNDRIDALERKIANRGLNARYRKDKNERA